MAGLLVPVINSREDVAKRLEAVAAELRRENRSQMTPEMWDAALLALGTEMIGKINQGARVFYKRQRDKAFAQSAGEVEECA